MKTYKYTILKQDGTVEVLPIGKQKDFKELYKILNCSIIQIIPDSYYPKEFGKCEVYGDEEGRFLESNHRNPHMKVLRGDPTIGEPLEWDCVGDLIKEEVIQNG